MANITFNGTGNVTASQSDAVTLAVDPQTFVSASNNGSGVVLAFTNGSITINGGTLAAGGLPNVFLQDGVFSQAGSPNTFPGGANGNVLAYLNPNGQTATFTSTKAANKLAIFGGQGVTDTTDGMDSIAIGGKGSFLVHGNAGADTITQTTAFDSTSVVNVFGDQGADTITLNNAANKASIFVSGGANAANPDVITVVNSGSTTIFGGIDSTDGSDTITFNGVTASGATTEAGGTSVIFGNGGNDTIVIGNTGNGLDSASATTVYGGFDNDTVNVSAQGATVSVLGGEGSDNIIVRNAGGSTYITGGNQSGDQSLDGADSISFTGSGNVLIYGNVGNDGITVNLNDSSAANVSIYGGKDNDTILVGGDSTGTHTVFVAGGENNDTITVEGGKGGTTIYGGISGSDSTDGDDTINYSSTGGVANIFGNAGNDTINIGQLGTADSTNASVNVNGGLGTDSINVVAQADGKQALNITGAAGSDTFTIASGTGRTVTITDFATTTTDGDNLAITNAMTNGGNGGQGQLGLVAQTYTTDQLQLALNAASAQTQSANSTSNVAAVRVGSDTYVVIENGTGSGTATFDASSDQAIKLTGVNDLVTLQAHTTITGSGLPPKFPFPPIQEL